MGVRPLFATGLLPFFENLYQDCAWNAPVRTFPTRWSHEPLQRQTVTQKLLSSKRRFRLAASANVSTQCTNSIPAAELRSITFRAAATMSAIFFAGVPLLCVRRE